MANFQQFTAIGNVTRDPELKELKSGTLVANFGIAINPSFTRKGEDEPTPLFFRCACFGNRGKALSELVSKGMPLLVVGEISQSTWTDKEGAERTSLEMTVNNWQFILNKAGNESIRGKSSDDSPSDSGVPWEKEEATS